MQTRHRRPFHRTFLRGLLAVSFVAALAAAGCTMYSRSPAQKPGAGGMPTPAPSTGMIPSSLQNPESVRRLVTWRDLQNLNPKLMSYRPWSTDEVSGAQVYGPSDKGPGMWILVARGNRVIGMRAVMPAGVPFKTWYDKTSAQGGQGGMAPGSNMGAGQTQTAYFVTPTRPGVGKTAGGTLVSATTASATASYANFQKVNPQWKSANRLSDFVTGMGYHWGHEGPGLVAMTDKRDHVVAFEATVPAKKDGSDWKPYYDQLPGKPMYDPKTGDYTWSQHVYLLAPEVIR